MAKGVLNAMLLLISQGRCISTLLVVDDIFNLGKLLIPFHISAFALETWAETSDSRNYTLNYIYETPFGLAVVAMDVCLLVFYCQNLCRTVQAEKDTRNLFFYRVWGSAYILWFMALPLTVVLSCVSSWSRYLFAPAV